MKAGYIFAAAWIAVVLAGSAHGQFVPGHVFAAQSAPSQCTKQFLGRDRIWEIDPESGQATLFVQIPEELCGFLTGLAFTPDGSRLRASMRLRSEILEFDSQGNMTIVLDSSDGIAAPFGFNNLAYDVKGNFYVAQRVGNILLFPVEGGLASVFADILDCGGPDAIAFAADGDLYCATTMFSIGQLRRMNPDGNAFPFDSFGSIFLPLAVTGDKSGHIYVGLGSADIFRYNAGDPDSKELLAVLPFGGRHSMSMSPDQSKIYVNTIGGATIGRLLAIDVVDGTVTTLAEFDDGFLVSPAGIAVVPIPPPPPIPTVSHWGMVILILLLLTAGTIAILWDRGIRLRTSVPPARKYRRQLL